jgi:hypothetical protein
VEAADSGQRSAEKPVRRADFEQKTAEIPLRRADFLQKRAEIPVCRADVLQESAAIPLRRGEFLASSAGDPLCQAAWQESLAAASMASAALLRSLPATAVSEGECAQIAAPSPQGGAKGVAAVAAILMTGTRRRERSVQRARLSRVSAKIFHHADACRYGVMAMPNGGGRAFNHAASHRACGPGVARFARNPRLKVRCRFAAGRHPSGMRSVGGLRRPVATLPRASPLGQLCHRLMCGTPPA